MRRKGRRRRGRSKDLDDDKCFRRWSVIYAIIRIVATNLSCRWCIMIATMYHCVCMHTLSMAVRGVGFLQKRHPLLDDCDAHKHGSRRYIGHLLSPACSRPTCMLRILFRRFYTGSQLSEGRFLLSRACPLRSGLPSKLFNERIALLSNDAESLGLSRRLGHFLAKFHGFLGF